MVLPGGGGKAVPLERYECAGGETEKQPVSSPHLRHGKGRRLAGMAGEERRQKGSLGAPGLEKRGKNKNEGIWGPWGAITVHSRSGRSHASVQQPISPTLPQSGRKMGRVLGSRSTPGISLSLRVKG